MSLSGVSVLKKALHRIDCKVDPAEYPFNNNIGLPLPNILYAISISPTRIFFVSISRRFMVCFVCLIAFKWKISIFHTRRPNRIREVINIYK